MNVFRPLASDGREPWIFRAESPEGLLVGVHPEAMAHALKAEEELLYLLYAPIWDAQPPGLGGKPQAASHAIAVTRSRFVVSRDEEHRGAAPRVWSIPFDDLLEVEIGRTFVTGWLTLRFAREGAMEALPIVFHCTAGGHHVAAAMRAYRRATCARGDWDDDESLSADWDEVWADRVYGLKELAAGVLLSGEAASEVLETQDSTAGDAPNPGLLLLTGCGLLHLRRVDEGIGGWMDFGVAARLLPLEGLSRAELLEPKDEARTGTVLSLVLARHGVEHELRIGLPRQVGATATHLRREPSEPGPQERR